MRCPVLYREAKQRADSVTSLADSLESAGKSAANLMGEFMKLKELHDDERAAEAAESLQQSIHVLRAEHMRVLGVENLVLQEANLFKPPTWRRVLRVFTFGLVSYG